MTCPANSSCSAYSDFVQHLAVLHELRVIDADVVEHVHDGLCRVTGRRLLRAGGTDQHRQ